MATTFDFLVIGAGSGGIAAANRAGAHGQRVGLIERHTLGGTCVNRGCVPKKVMWNAAHITGAHRYARDYGFDTPTQPALDWSTLVKNRDAYIERIHQSYQRSFEKNAVTYIQGPARFVDAHTVDVNGQLYTAPHILIATGGHPIKPDIPNSEYGVTSDDFFTWKESPKSVAIVGAGYIAVELAGMLHMLGVHTHLLIRKDKPLRRFDSLLSTTLTQTMQNSGLNLHQHTLPERVERLDNGLLKLHIHHQEPLIVEQLIWAIGRAPNIQGLNLQDIGVTCSKHGYIEVDDWQNTSVTSIYAVGDVTGRVELTPVAVAAGRALAERLFNKRPDAKINYENVATVVFSHPPIGTIGLTQTQAEEKYGQEQLRVYQSEFTNMYSAVTTHREPTRMKIICTGPDEIIVGLHLIGEGCDEILQGFAVAINMGATKADLDRCIAIHPTSAEELVTLTKANLI